MAFNPANPTHITELATEINTDPQTIGFAAHVTSGAHSTIAFLLNDTTTYSVSVDVVSISPDVAQGAVDATEWDARTTNKLLQWQTLMGLPSIPVGQGTIKSQIQAIWPVASTTRANLAALQTKSGSRAEELWGDGSVISAPDVSAALAA